MYNKNNKIALFPFMHLAVGSEFLFRYNHEQDFWVSFLFTLVKHQCRLYPKEAFGGKQ